MTTNVSLPNFTKDAALFKYHDFFSKIFLTGL